jgi:hypothetical protein
MAATPRRVLPRGALGLRDFLHRSRVLAQYREFMRELRCLGPDSTAAKEMREQIREGFAKYAGERNRASQRQLLADGARQLQFLRSYVSTAQRAQRAAGVEALPDTWVGSGDGWDIRGRIGEGWAWEEPRAPDGADVGTDTPPPAERRGPS